MLNNPDFFKTPNSFGCRQHIKLNVMSEYNMSSKVHIWIASPSPPLVVGTNPDQLLVSSQHTSSDPYSPDSAIDAIHSLIGQALRVAHASSRHLQSVARQLQ